MSNRCMISIEHMERKTFEMQGMFDRLLEALNDLKMVACLLRALMKIMQVS